MIYGSVCSGVEAATVAWHSLGWTPAWFSEIEPFPSRVLAHHYPNVPNLGDMLKLHENETFQKTAIDLLVGGTPCQSFSIAGLRGGITDKRGNLALEFCRILATKRPRWFIWENVPGVFSSFSDNPDSIFLPDEDRTQTSDFASILSGFQECGYSCAWRVLDSRFFGVPQRRRRIFVVGYIGNDWRPPAAVLFEPNSMRGNPTKSRKKGKGTTGTAEFCPTDDSRPGDDRKVVATLDASFAKLQGASGQDANHGHSHLVAYGSNNQSGPINVASSINTAGTRHDFATETLILFNIMPMNSGKDFTVRESEVFQPLTTQQGFGNQGGDVLLQAPIPINMQIATRANKLGERTGFGIGEPGDPSFTLQANHHHAVCSAFQSSQSGVRMGNIFGTLDSNYGGRRLTGIINGVGVRRITPLEAERLQGFPDNYTLIQKAADGPRYKAMGNSMTTKVMKWLGSRVDHVDKQMEALKNK